jgi:hypothetical protein
MITVKDLKDHLNKFDENLPVVEHHLSPGVARPMKDKDLSYLIAEEVVEDENEAQDLGLEVNDHYIGFNME